METEKGCELNSIYSYSIIIVATIIVLIGYNSILPHSKPFSAKNELITGTIGKELNHTKRSGLFSKSDSITSIGTKRFSAIKGQLLLINYDVEIKTGVLGIDIYRLDVKQNALIIKKNKIGSSSKDVISVPIPEDGLYCIFISGLDIDYDIKYNVNWGLNAV